MQKLRFYIIACLTALTLAIGCGPEGPPPNPFELAEPKDTLIAPIEDLDPTTIEGIHATVFRPTCANSGCHDGNFEPDFRSVESSYNTLVMHPIIKNDPGGNFSMRVVPGNADASVLWERLNRDIDGQSGIMPLEIDPDSDWPDKKNEYLDNIRTWIQNGARDVFGNPPASGSLRPSAAGVVIFPSGTTNTPYSRKGSNGSVRIPAGAGNVDIWFSIQDDQTAPDQLQHNKARRSTGIDDFAGTGNDDVSIQNNPITRNGLFGEPVPFYHRWTINVNAYNPGDVVYFRIYVQEPGEDITSIPADGSASYVKEYFSIVMGN